MWGTFEVGYLIVEAEKVLKLSLLEGPFQVVPVIVDLLTLFLHFGVFGVFLLLGLFSSAASTLSRLILDLSFPFTEKKRNEQNGTMFRKTLVIGCSG